MLISSRNPGWYDDIIYRSIPDENGKDGAKLNKAKESVRQDSGIGPREARAIGSILYLLRKMTLRKINHILWYCQRVG